jgi:hypothetical protein
MACADTGGQSTSNRCAATHPVIIEAAQSTRSTGPSKGTTSCAQQSRVQYRGPLLPPAPECYERSARRLMLNTLLRFRTEIGQVLAILACTLTMIYFQYVFDWSWYASVPVGVLAFASMLTVWWWCAAYLEGRS